MFKIKFCLDGTLFSGISTMNFLPRIGEVVFILGGHYTVINVMYNLEEGHNDYTPVTIVADKINPLNN